MDAEAQIKALSDQLEGAKVSLEKCRVHAEELKDARDSLSSLLHKEKQMKDFYKDLFEHEQRVTEALCKTVEEQ